jgi:glycosyltransferase involved in cell wall biosynthesis
MKIAIYTVDLYPGRERLMPWRTLLEVAEEMKNRNIEVDLITASVERENQDYIYQKLRVKVVPRNFSLLAEYINENMYDALYFPLTWRDGFKDLSALKLITCSKIGYFPGGVYSKNNVLALYKWGSFKACKPYLLEYLAPKKKLIRKLKNYDFTTIIGLTETTTQSVKSFGWQKAKTILTGKDSFENLEINQNLLSSYDLEGKRFFLFTGAPAVTRGSQCLLRAFDRLVDENADAQIVFLMRTDVGSKYKEFTTVYESLKHKDKIKIINATLTPSDLKTFMSQAYSVVLPFLVIPSEIPITFLEVLSCGTPIITFENGGTTAYMKDAILCGNPGNIDSLFGMMHKLWNNNQLRNELSLKGLSLMKTHPNWSFVADQWINILK